MGKEKTMFRFENKMCPVCRKRFHEGDDIAVCPECGTPHHRACYLETKKCALEELHKTGFVWNGRLPDEPMPVPDISALIKASGSPEEPVKESSDDDEKTLMLLGLSGLNNDEREEFKQIKNNSSMKDLIGAIGDESKGDDGVSMQELIAYTGTSVWHFSRAFNSFRGMNPDGKKHFVSFNLCSGLLAPIYQFYRKMDMLGIAAILLSLLPSLIVFLTGNGGSSAAQYMLLNLLGILPVVLLCIFGDYLIYLKAVKRIRKIREKFEGKTDSLEYLKALADSGRPSIPRAALGALAMIFANVCMITLGLQ